MDGLLLIFDGGVLVPLIILLVEDSIDVGLARGLATLHRYLCAEEFDPSNGEIVLSVSRDGTVVLTTQQDGGCELGLGYLFVFFAHPAGIDLIISVLG